MELYCRSCGDTARRVKMPSGERQILCLECFAEKTRGLLPRVTDSRGSRPALLDPSPSGENAIRCMEDAR